MPTSVISAFDRETAGKVVEELVKAGFPERDVAVLEGGEDEIEREIVARGFGRTLVEQAVAYELGGRARLDFEPQGVSYELEAALAAAA